MNTRKKKKLCNFMAGLPRETIDADGISKNRVFHRLCVLLCVVVCLIKIYSDR